MDYKIIRSKRKTVALSVDKSGQVIVRAGYRVKEDFIENFVYKNLAWIEKQQKDIFNKKRIVIEEKDIPIMKKQAAAEMKRITEKYSQIMGLEPADIKITSAKTRWGSCSGRNSICYSYRVMVLDEKCREYIAVHELAHIKEKNHSANFYKIIEKYMPQYREIQKQIKEVIID